MPFEWNFTYSLNIPSIDNQHQKLFSLINQFEKALNDGASKNDLQNYFDELIDYTVYHFDHEEKMFDEFKYAETEEHKDEHQKLKQTVADLKVKFEDDDYDKDKLIKFLIDWLKYHILITDKKYANFLIGKGAR